MAFLGLFLVLLVSKISAPKDGYAGVLMKVLNLLLLSCKNKKCSTLSMKRKLIEYFIALVAKIFGKWPREPEMESVLVLRNNNIGDLLTTTSLFQALKDNFPELHIIAGIGKWNTPVLENNPYIDEVLILDAPWHNTISTHYAPNSFLGFIKAINYILFSRQPKHLLKPCTIGIDVLGSPQGSLLFLKMGIPYRIGVRGYAGGHSACQDTQVFDDKIHVSQFASNFVKQLGGEAPKCARPQLFITNKEEEEAENHWRSLSPKRSLRILMGTGGSYQEKCWPIDHYAQLVKLLDKDWDCTFIAVGSQEDHNACAQVSDVAISGINLAGKTSLRITFALAKTADLVICNSSMLMHVSAAFNIHTTVLLGNDFPSAIAHEKLWGYPDTHVILGKDIHHDAIYIPEEVITVMESKGWLRG